MRHTNWQGSRSSRSLYRELARHLLPRVLATYLPWYTPHALEVPLEVTARGPFHAARSGARPAPPGA